MSNSVRPHRRQPTRLRRPWDSPSKNPGEVSVRFFAILKFTLVVFLLLTCLSSLYEMQSFFIRYVFCNWFVPVCTIFFYFLDSVFCRVEVFHFTFFFSFFEFPILRKSSLPIFSLIVYAFGVVAEKPSPKQGLSCFLLYYFFKFYQCSSVT